MLALRQRGLGNALDVRRIKKRSRPYSKRQGILSQGRESARKHFPGGTRKRENIHKYLPTASH